MESAPEPQIKIEDIKQEENAPVEGPIEENAPPENDPYAYLDRSDFSSEKFKIEIKNLPKIYGISEFRKLLNNKLKLNSTKIKAPKRNSPYAFVCFRSDEDRNKAIETLSGFKWKGKPLQAIRAKPSPDPLVKKRKEDSEEGPNKKIKIDNRSQEEKLKSSTIPLWDVPYEEQLKTKQEEARNILKRLGNELARQNPDLREWLNKQKEKFDGLPCELLNIRYADECDGYRNKCSFTVGIDEETKLPTVGFRIGSYVNGITGVGSIESLKHIPESMKLAVKLFQDYVRASDLQVFNFEVHTGHFRQLTIRTAQDQIIIAGEDSDGSEHLWGDTHICETLLGLKFKISPEAFFQINTKGAEILYKSIIELASPTEDSTVLDVCCGTGTIGLCFAKNCKKVLGIEIVPQAIIDAKANAKLNEIENSEFFEGKAEEILGSVCYRAMGDVVAVVDPPRAGLQQKAVVQIRKINKIGQLVYVSCNPAAALKNFIDIGRPASKTLHNEPLVPVRAVVVDMFPHTRHCELIISFKRFDKLLIVDSDSK
ncbi:tRNA (uracil-5-)-methyltransferase homolog A isoform X2 [Tribolium castaneum]|uniref:tRNA (uracil-5-)-methyltransferase homolog A isoform X2 n=1 Tax=Tribolium castaneum TaxID=7070 RepID=UPI00077DDCBA|nr:PREDICTED: tRNA (uracil-5-)-methyltransferase homolog A isoform X2 [Tribolium castaneum]|eukprot:XP_015837917.1 PREDICTED: tRNA (uracil-5-)-methyltransferase homolog A isoform X2 [Tribolium castaneum]